MADDFFTNDDPFEDIVSSFFGRPVRRARRTVRQEEEESDASFLETPNTIYCIIEAPGYTEDEVLVKVKARELEVQAQKKNMSGVKEYLAPKLEKGFVIQRMLPESASSKKFTYTYKNGIVEVRFDTQ